MSYLLFYNPDSANIVVRMALEELGADYQDERVASRREKRSAEFMTLNPRGLLPVLVDGAADAVLAETGAILLYLADKHWQLAPLQEMRGERAMFLKWLFFISNTLHADLRLQFYTERYVSGGEAVEALRARARERISAHLKLAEDDVDQIGPFFHGPDVTVVDFYLAACIRWAQLYPAGNGIDPSVIDGFPRLKTWLLDLEKRPSVQRAFEREGIKGAPFYAPTPAAKSD